MSKLLSKPKKAISTDSPAKFERFSLSENPFPAEPAVNKDSMDRRMNGSIYESEIRSPEYEKIRTRFLVQPQDNPNHLRLGYIIDTSYIGRGNGKSAFLVNLQQIINKNYCLDISNEANKCFAIVVNPETGGRTKTFSNFVDSLFTSILQSGIIRNCLATLRLEAILEIYEDKQELCESFSEDELISNLNDEKWFEENEISFQQISAHILKDDNLQSLPSNFPLFIEQNSFIAPFVTEKDFVKHYQELLKKPKDKIDFIFSHLVYMFISAGFNGAYVFVDNFEQISVFQSAKQKLDFAFELRSCLFDGSYTSSRLGFYNFLLVFHAGVQRLISEAWAASGMENRSPISSPTVSNHVIQFEKLNGEHVALLLKKYLSEYRIVPNEVDEIYPFTKESIDLIGQIAEFNASKILRLAYDLLEKLADSPDKNLIDKDFVNSVKEIQGDDFNKPIATIEVAETINLLDKINK